MLLTSKKRHFALFLQNYFFKSHHFFWRTSKLLFEMSQPFSHSFPKHLLMFRNFDEYFLTYVYHPSQLKFFLQK